VELAAGDAVHIEEEALVVLSEAQAAEVLLFDLPR
jgi:hypothetical protein